MNWLYVYWIWFLVSHLQVIKEHLQTHESSNVKVVDLMVLLQKHIFLQAKRKNWQSTTALIEVACQCINLLFLYRNPDFAGIVRAWNILWRINFQFNTPAVFNTDSIRKFITVQFTWKTYSHQTFDFFIWKITDDFFSYAIFSAFHPEISDVSTGDILSLSKGSTTATSERLRRHYYPLRIKVNKYHCCKKSSLVSHKTSSDHNLCRFQLSETLHTAESDTGNHRKKFLRHPYGNLHN